MSTIATLRQAVCSMMQQTNTAIFTVNGIDLFYVAANNARRAAESVNDFFYSQDDVLLSITSTGGSIASSSVKRVSNVRIPITGGYLPIEFLTNDEWLARVRRQAGRVAYTATNSPAQCGLSQINPVAYQQGQKIYLQLPASFTFPIAASLSVIKWLADYASDADTDFILNYGFDFMEAQTIVELNKISTQFAYRVEGNLPPPEDTAAAALARLLQWDASISGDTSTPKRAPQAPMSTQPKAPPSAQLTSA